MRAHVLNSNGVIVNTIEVETLDFMPGLVDAAIGGQIGDAIMGGQLIPSQGSTTSSNFLAEKEAYLVEVREMREKLLGRLYGYGTQLLMAEPPERADEKALCNDIIDGLLAMTTIEPVITATTMAELKGAVKAEYARLVGLASDDMKLSFRKADL